MTTAPNTRAPRGKSKAALAAVPDPDSITVGESGTDSGGIITPAAHLVMLPVDAVAAHPDNVRADLGDLDALGASIKTYGLMQPLLTVTVADHRAAHPDHEFAPGVTHVARAGHRRLAAAQQVGVTELPALVVPGQQSAVAYVTMLTTPTRCGPPTSGSVTWWATRHRAEPRPDRKITTAGSRPWPTSTTTTASTSRG